MKTLSRLADSHLNITNPYLHTTWIDDTTSRRIVKVAALILTAVVVRVASVALGGALGMHLIILGIGTSLHKAASEYFKPKYNATKDLITFLAHLKTLNVRALQNTSIGDILRATNTSHCSQKGIINKDIINTAIKAADLALELRAISSFQSAALREFQKKGNFKLTWEEFHKLLDSPPQPAELYCIKKQFNERKKLYLS